MTGSSQWLAPIQAARWVLNTILHQALAVVAVYAIWIPIQQYSTPFSWHVILCVLGIIPFMAEAFILFGGDNVWSQEIDRKTKFLIHGILMTISATLIIAGISIEIDNKSQAGYTHFTSAHAITGLSYMILLCVSLIFGILTYFSKSLMGYVRPVVLKFTHNILGQVSFIVGIATLCLGYQTNWFSSRTSEESRITATVATAILCVLSLKNAIISSVKLLRNIVNK